MNSRLDEVQAAVLRVKLRHLESENATRRERADLYHARLSATDLGLPAVRAGATHVWHQYVVRSARRDELRDMLRRQAVGTLVHYPVPVHQQPAYRGRLALDPSGLLATEAAAREVLSLPMHGHLAERDAERVAAKLGRILEP
jgi:dTDP-4-amino-4,6-dideoxygalactose transaminase